VALSFCQAFPGARKTVLRAPEAAERIFMFVFE
jgi:hypothetical protein